MNALYSVYSLHISSSKIKPLLKICKVLTDSDFLLCSHLYTSQFKGIKNAQTILE